MEGILLMDIRDNYSVLSRHKVKINHTSFFKEYVYEDCCVKNNVVITFEILDETVNGIYKIKCCDATPIGEFSFAECVMSVYDVTDLKYDSVHFKILFLHDEKVSDILCDTIELVSEITEYENFGVSLENTISDINKTIEDYHLIKALHYNYSDGFLTEFAVDITQDSYMLDKDDIRLVLENPKIQELKYIEYMYSLNFTLDLYSQEKHCKYLMIAEIDDMINSIEVLSESVKLIKYYENKTEDNK